MITKQLFAWNNSHDAHNCTEASFLLKVKWSLWSRKVCQYEASFTTLWLHFFWEFSMWIEPTDSLTCLRQNTLKVTFVSSQKNIFSTLNCHVQLFPSFFFCVSKYSLLHKCNLLGHCAAPLLCSNFIWILWRKMVHCMSNVLTYVGYFCYVLNFIVRFGMSSLFFVRNATSLS